MILQVPTASVYSKKYFSLIEKFYIIQNIINLKTFIIKVTDG